MPCFFMINLYLKQIKIVKTLNVPFYSIVMDGIMHRMAFEQFVSRPTAANKKEDYILKAYDIESIGLQKLINCQK